jgi:hypothetical protein
VRRIWPASRKERELCIDIAPGLVHERVVLTLSYCDGQGERRVLDTLLTSLEARRVAHAALDAMQGAERAWPITVQPVHQHDSQRYFDVGLADNGQGHIVVRLRLGAARGSTRSFAIPFSPREAHQLGHSLLAAANRSRLASRDD